MANKKKSTQSNPRKKVKSYNTRKTKSVVGSIYTYKKRKKPKRLGKTCIYFNTDKLTCKSSNHLCKDADNCQYYVANMKEIQNTQVKQSSAKKKQISMK